MNYSRQPRPDQLRAMKRIYKTERQLIWGGLGTGKTKVALDFIQVMLKAGKITRALIVAPLTALVGTWEEQMEIDAPGLAYSFMVKGIKTNWDCPVVLSNYDYFISRRVKKRDRFGQVIPDKYERDKTRINMLLDWKPDVVILDESHKIRNRNSQSAKVAHKLGRVCKYAICLTGTPKGNKRVLDLWSQFKFLKSDLLEERFEDFKFEHTVYKGYEQKKFRNLDVLAGKIKPFMTRMKLTGLPETTDIPYRVDMDLHAKKLYKQMEKDFIAEIDKETVVTAPIVLAKLMKLSQLSGGFIRGNDGVYTAVHRNKLEALQEICDELLENDTERVVIFCRFRWEIDEIAKLLAPNWVTYKIDGRAKPHERQLAVRLFNGEAGGAMICQIGTGSASLNLQTANYMIFYSTDYSFINYTQGRGRIHRLGQTKPCFYYQLRCKGTLDAKIYRLLNEHKDAENEFMRLVDEIRRDL